eukprot:m.364177 g.364177  ORF g.364177 m.364177 type:complete len:464 (-) comp25864_c0_seq1:220-1611(-)
MAQSMYIVAARDGGAAATEISDQLHHLAIGNTIQAIDVDAASLQPQSVYMTPEGEKNDCSRVSPQLDRRTREVGQSKHQQMGAQAATIPQYCGREGRHKTGMVASASSNTRLVKWLFVCVFLLIAAVAAVLAVLYLKVTSRLVALEDSVFLPEASTAMSVIQRVLECNEQALIYDKDTGTCKVPPSLTTSTFPSCTAQHVGLTRYNSAIERFEVCFRSDFYTLLSHVGSQDVPALSCKQIRALHPTLPSGPYWLASVSDDGMPYQVYCDMTRDGGGWTLVMKIADRVQKNFHYHSTYWNTTSTLNSNSVRPDDNTNHISLAYSQLPFTQIRLAMHTEDNNHVHNITQNSTRALLTGSTVSVSIRRESFMELISSVADASEWNLQLNCNRAGFAVNAFDENVCRYGILMNNEADCITSDSAIGFGCYQRDTSTNVGCGGYTTWDHFSASTLDDRWISKGWIYVR